MHKVYVCIWVRERIPTGWRECRGRWIRREGLVWGAEKYCCHHSPPSGTPEYNLSVWNSAWDTVNVQKLLLEWKEMHNWSNFHVRTPRSTSLTSSTGHWMTAPESKLSSCKWNKKNIAQTIYFCYFNNACWLVSQSTMWHGCASL
jgi:hypothetical protein